MNTISQITLIGSELKDAKSDERVVIRNQESFRITHGYDFYQNIPDMLHWSFPAQYKQENQATIDYFYKVFGRKKVDEISDQFELFIDYKRRWGLPVKRSDVEKLFTGLSVIYYEELEPFFDELKKIPDGQSYLHLSSDDVKMLKKELDQTRLMDLSNQQLKKLYRAMIPFQDLKTIFLNRLPDGEFSNSAHPATNYEDFKKFVYCYEVMRRKGIEDFSETSTLEQQKKFKLFHQIRMTKKLMNFYFPERKIDEELTRKIIFETPKGLLYQFAKREAGGAFVIAMKAIKPEPEKRFLSRLYFLPTQCLNRVAQPWESLSDDLRGEVGAMGAEMIYPDVQRLLMPTKAFVKEGEQIDLLGYSLGGNHALRVATALYPTNRVRKVFVTSNPALDLKTVEYFNMLVQRFKHNIKLSFSGEWDDHTMRYGNCHLGWRADAEYVKIRYRTLVSRDLTSLIPFAKDYKAAELLKFPEREVCRVNAFYMASLLLRSLNDGHPREAHLIRGIKEHAIRNYPKAEDSFESEEEKAKEFSIRQRYLDRFILTNIGYGWEEQRFSLLESFYKRFEKTILKHAEDRPYVDFLKSIHTGI